MFDHNQTSRLGQQQAPENPGIRIVTLEEMPEVAYRGQMVYLSDVDYILVYDGDAWQTVGDSNGGGGAVNGSRMFVSSSDPQQVESNNVVVGDQWLETGTRVLRFWSGTGWESAVLPENSVGATQLAVNAITAKHVITGPLIQTTEAASRGIKLNAAGMTAYSSTGVTTFNIAASTGAVSMLGTLTAGVPNGERIVVRSDGSGGIIEAFSGTAGETPSTINPRGLVSGLMIPGLVLTAGSFAGYNSLQPYFSLLTSGSNQGTASIVAPTSIYLGTGSLSNFLEVSPSGTEINGNVAFTNAGAVSVSGRLNVTGKLDLVSNGSRPISVINFGTSQDSPDANGLITVSHGMAMGTSGNYQVFVQSFNNGAARFFTVMEKNPNNFKFRVNGVSGDVVTNVTGIRFDYLIVAG